MHGKKDAFKRFGIYFDAGQEKRTATLSDTVERSRSWYPITLQF